MSTTPNYNWPLIEPTDFVTNLPADLETLADAIDTSFAADEGDLLVGGTSNIFEPLPIGAAGTVLTSDGTTADWAAPAGGGGSNYTLLNSGNTALNTLSTLTISGLDVENLLILVTELTSTNSSLGAQLRVRFNSDTGNNYDSDGSFYNSATSYSSSNAGIINSFGIDYIELSRQGNNAGDYFSGGLKLYGGKSTDRKVGTFVGGATGTNSNSRAGVFVYKGTSAISSVTIYTSVGTFDGGNVYIYGSAS